MRKKVFLCMIQLFVFMNAIVLIYANEKIHSLIEDLKSPDYDTSYSAVYRFNKMIKNKETISSDLLAAGYKLIDEFRNNNLKVKLDSDDEGNYAWEVSVLAANLATPELLPFFIRGIPGEPAVLGILKVGDVGIEKMVTEKLGATNSARQDVYLVLAISKIIKIGKMKNIPISEHSLKVLKEGSYKLLEKYDGMSGDVLTKNDDVVSLRKNILRFYQELNDPTTLPYIEKMAKTDSYKKMKPRNLEPLRAVKKDGTKKTTAELLAENARASQIIEEAKKTGDYVERYPIREFATEVMQDIKRKNGIK